MKIRSKKAYSKKNRVTEQSAELDMVMGNMIEKTVSIELIVGDREQSIEMTKEEAIELAQKILKKAQSL